MSKKSLAIGAGIGALATGAVFGGRYLYGKHLEKKLGLKDETDAISDDVPEENPVETPSDEKESSEE